MLLFQDRPISLLTVTPDGRIGEVKKAFSPASQGNNINPRTTRDKGSSISDLLRAGNIWQRLLHHNLRTNKHHRRPENITAVAAGLMKADAKPGLSPVWVQ